ncbi:MAG: glycosyl hydrolase family 28-related protein, partial [Planctomycetota bacterium]
MADSAVIDVTRWSEDAALNANPAPGNNDYAALQAVINEFAGTGRIIYLPAGEYEIDQPLIMPIEGSNRATANTILQGFNRDETTIKLTDNQNVDGAAIQFQVITADAFRNAVRDLTIDVGTGNPLADGLRFTGNNQATVKNVHIRSSDASFAGDVGLELGTGENGPLLVENVSIDGFDVGIRTAVQTASQTFESISLSNQQVFGWVNEADQNVFVRNLTSVNEVRAIHNFPFRFGENSVFTLVDSRLEGIGEATNVSAILTEERFYAANVETPEYQRPVEYRQSNGFIAGNRDLEGDFIEEYWSEGGENRKTGGTFELFEGSPDGSLRLPTRNAPEIPFDTDLSRWASPTSYVTQNADGSPSGIAGDDHDDSLAIQAAIDSGATTIYFPNEGVWLIDDVVTVRGNVERLIGLESRLATITGDGRVRLNQTAADAVVIERFAGSGRDAVKFEHVSSQTIVGRNMQGFEYVPATDSPGDVFLLDVVNGGYEFRNQNVWAWQLNVEGRADVNDDSLPDQKILNDNANLWVLGTKIENQGTIVRTINGGRTELLGVYRNNNEPSDADNPAFVNVDSSLSVVNFDAATAAGNAYALWISETRGSETRTSERFDGGHVYSGFADSVAWDTNREVVVDNRDPEVTLTGTWQNSATLPGGYLDSDIAYSDEPGAQAAFTPDLPIAGDYEVFIRWIDDFGGQDHSGHGNQVPVDVVHAGGTASTTVNQRTGGGRWVSLGVFEFEAGTDGEVVLSTEGTSERTIADGVRFSFRGNAGDAPTLTPQFPIHPTSDVFETGIFAGGTYAFSGADGLLENDIELNGQPLSISEVSPGIGGTIEVDD